MPDEAGAEATQAETVSKAEHEERVKSLSKEAASYRAQRNEALREGAAFKSMLTAFNVDTTLDTHKLADLKIEDGQVSGSYEYSPPKPTAPTGSGTPTFADNKDTSLTREQLEKMSYDDINANWDKVQAAMKLGL